MFAFLGDRVEDVESARVSVRRASGDVQTFFKRRRAIMTFVAVSIVTAQSTVIIRSNSAVNFVRAAVLRINVTHSTPASLAYLGVAVKSTTAFAAFDKRPLTTNVRSFWGVDGAVEGASGQDSDHALAVIGIVIHVGAVKIVIQTRNVINASIGNVVASVSQRTVRLLITSEIANVVADPFWLRRDGIEELFAVIIPAVRGVRIDRETLTICMINARSESFLPFPIASLEIGQLVTARLTR
jgi:hypothetical protein